MQTSNSEEKFTIKNKPHAFEVYTLTLFSLMVASSIYLLSANIFWTTLPLIILVCCLTIMKLALRYKIFFTDQLFEIHKTIFGINYYSIRFAYNHFVYQKKDTYFYLKNSKKTLSIIYEDDVDGEYIDVLDDKRGKRITISENAVPNPKIIINRLLCKLKSNEITTANSGFK